jgi:hypothetical protein
MLERIERSAPIKMSVIGCYCGGTNMAADAASIMISVDA